MPLFVQNDVLAAFNILWTTNTSSKHVEEYELGFRWVENPHRQVLRVRHGRVAKGADEFPDVHVSSQSNGATHSVQVPVSSYLRTPKKAHEQFHGFWNTRTEVPET